MPTLIQQHVARELKTNQMTTLRGVQNKITGSHTAVTEDQWAAMQAAWDVAKASGIPLSDKLKTAAKNLGLILN